MDSSVSDSAMSARKLPAAAYQAPIRPSNENDTSGAGERESAIIENELLTESLDALFENDHFLASCKNSPQSEAAAAAAGGSLDTKVNMSCGHIPAASSSLTQPGSRDHVPSIIATMTEIPSTSADDLAANFARVPPSTRSFFDSEKKRPFEGFMSRHPAGKRAKEASEVSENEDERVRRRVDRNYREQQRSKKITQQIDVLRDMLVEANVQFKPDKYSTLVSVVGFIKRLQDEASSIEAEHRKLLDTVAQTNEIMNNQYVQAKAMDKSPLLVPSDDLVKSGEDRSVSPLDDDSISFVNGIDYRSAFMHCGVAQALCSIDGRIIDCNQEFEDLSGCKRSELLRIDSQGPQLPGAGVDAGHSERKNLSIFDLLVRNDMEKIFVAMSEMLTVPVAPGSKFKEHTVRPEDCWSEIVCTCRNQDQPIRMNISLSRNSAGHPKFFHCALVTDEDAPDSRRQHPA